MALLIYLTIMTILAVTGVVAIMHHAPRMARRAIHAAWWYGHVRRCMVQNRCL